MSIVIVSVISVLILCALAYRADALFHSEERLPMQWWITGEVTWSAPRRLALAFMPALAIVLLGFVTIMALNVPARPGQSGPPRTRRLRSPYNDRVGRNAHRGAASALLAHEQNSAPTGPVTSPPTNRLVLETRSSWESDGHLVCRYFLGRPS
ncbi:hypothetical protein [Sphingomonas sanguinis]|uniref:hypothetical protein n=1 Tax=Sphingomonas sanguinis TaxID=33051 RepID=UPI00128F9B27|nr:hypothetical protein [Sphingomonas sanguinis]